MKTTPLPPLEFRDGLSPAMATVCVVVLLALQPFSAGGKPEIRQGFFDANPTALGTRLDNLPSRSGHCGVCHYRFQGGGERNPYGSRVEAAIASYPKTAAGYRDANLSIRSVD